MKSLISKKVNETPKVNLNIHSNKHYGNQKSIFVRIAGIGTILSIIKRITQKHRIYVNNLNESEIRYRRLFETAKDGILILDAETGMIVDVNPFLIDLLGFSKDKFIKKAIWDIGFFKDIVANKDKFLELQQNEYVRYENLPLETSNGNRIYVEFVSNVYLVHDKKVIQCNIRDITERVIADMELKEKETQFHNLADAGLALIWTTDIHKKFNYLNKPWQEFTGKTLLQEIEIGWETDLHPDDARQSKDIFSNAFDNRERFGLEYRILNAKGEYRWLYKTGSPNLNSKNEFIGYIGHCIDITERKQIESELDFAKAKAEENDKLKTAFLQNMSHEIRTPLNGIIGFSRLLNDDNLSKSEIKNFTSFINQSGVRLMEIVNNVLDISRIQTGQVKIVLSQFQIDKVLVDLRDFFTLSAIQKNIEIVINNHDDDATTIYSDESKLVQIFTNLINNSIKFTDYGKIEIGYLKSPTQIQFYVRDSGIGIAPELLDKIFEVFVQADVNLTRNYEGAGLGLAICKGDVELLGGKIWVESEIGVGSTFYFTTALFPVAHITKPENITLHISSNKKQKIILIVEDDLISYQLFQKILSDTDCALYYAVNGEQAVDLVINHPEIDLILMDIRMPVMGGFEATQKIKQLRPDLPIIDQTAYAFSNEKTEIFASGCDDYISKPIDKDELLKLVNKYLK